MKHVLIAALLCVASLSRAGTLDLAPDGCAMHPLSSGGCTQTVQSATDGHQYCQMSCTTGQGFTTSFNFPGNASTSAPHFQSTALALSQSSAGNLCMSYSYFCCQTDWNATASASTSCISMTQLGSTVFSTTPVGNEGGANKGVWTALGTAQDSATFGVHDVCFARFDRVASGGGCTDTAQTNMLFVDDKLLYNP